MFGLFKKKSEKDQMHEQYQKLTKEAHNLSATNRRLSDQKVYEAEEIMKKLENLK
ncbi:MAG: transcription elongation GreA/GreB family factor [Flavobacteriaceae bacterium]|jgi:transcription elongation GreA/GreB family factor